MNLSSLSGMQAASLLLDATADNIANLNTPGHRTEQVGMATTASGGVAASVTLGGEGVDLVDQVANLITGSLLYTANARVTKVGADTEQALLDILA